MLRPRNWWATITHMLLTREGFVYLATVTGLLLEKNCWLRHGGTHANRIGPKRSGNGSEELLTRQGCDDFSFGSGIAVHVRRLHRHHEQVWSPRIGGNNRRVLRQRSSSYHSTPPAGKNSSTRRIYHTRRKAIKEVTSWIELCYNQTRLHSAIGYRTPNEVHQDMGKTKTAA